MKKTKFPSRSEKSGPILAWTTDRNLKVLAVSREFSGLDRSLPIVGMVIQPSKNRTGFLNFAAHARALKGRRVSYRFTLFRRSYRIDLEPRYNRKRSILGVEGWMRLASVEPGGSGGRAAPDSMPSIREISRQRRGNAAAGIIRSLELSKAVADSTRLHAEARLHRAIRVQSEASEARRRAETAERRAKFLSDASALMDVSFDETTNVSRVAELLVGQYADWCVIHFKEGSLFHRVALQCREAADRPLLEAAFPKEDDASFYGKILTGQSELFSVLSPLDVLGMVPNPMRGRALRDTRTESVLRVPIRWSDRTLGMLTFGSSDPIRIYDIDDQKTALALAHRFALARESSRLYQEAQREIILRKEAEARLRVFNQDLERRVAERTSLLEEATREANSFAYTVAHDLRAPLRAITGFCQALREDYAGAIDGTGQDYLERIIMGARRMDLLIRDLLDYARLNRAEIRREIVDLDEVMDGVKGSMAAELEERHATVEVAAPLGRAVAQATVFSQILTNLLSNAVKFVAPGVPPRIRVWSEFREGRIRVVLEDNGIGIAPEHRERIFGIFERLNRAEDYPGTGIGLAIVRRGVERLGGLVGVEAAPERGSRFWVELAAPFELKSHPVARHERFKSS